MTQQELLCLYNEGTSAMEQVFPLLVNWIFPENKDRFTPNQTIAHLIGALRLFRESFQSQFFEGKQVEIPDDLRRIRRLPLNRQSKAISEANFAAANDIVKEYHCSGYFLIKAYVEEREKFKGFIMSIPESRYHKEVAHPIVNSIGSLEFMIMKWIIRHEERHLGQLMEKQRDLGGEIPLLY